MNIKARLSRLESKASAESKLLVFHRVNSNECADKIREEYQRRGDDRPLFFLIRPVKKSDAKI